MGKQCIFEERPVRPQHCPDFPLQRVDSEGPPAHVGNTGEVDTKDCRTGKQMHCGSDLRLKQTPRGTMESQSRVRCDSGAMRTGKRSRVSAALTATARRPGQPSYVSSMKASPRQPLTDMYRERSHSNPAAGFYSQLRMQVTHRETEESVG